MNQFSSVSDVDLTKFRVNHRNYARRIASKKSTLLDSGLRESFRATLPALRYKNHIK